MMCVRFVLSLACAVAACGQTAVDPRVIQLLPADTSFVLGVQWRQFADSEAAKSLQKQFASTLSSLPVAGAATNFRDFLWNDIDSILLAAPGSAAAQLSSKTKQAPLLVVLKGRFNLAKIREMANEKKGATELYQEVEVLRISGMKPPTMRLSVLDGTTMIFGDYKEVLSAIDRRKGTAPGTAPARIAARINDMAATNDVFFVGQIPPKMLTSQESSPAMQAFRDVSAFDFGLSFREGMAMRANLITKGADAAKALSSTLQTLVALAAQDDKDRQAAAMMNRLAITADGAKVNLALSMTADELEAMMKQRTPQRQPERAGPPIIDGAEGSTVVTPVPRETRNKGIRITGLDGGPVELPASDPKK